MGACRLLGKGRQTLHVHLPLLRSNLLNNLLTGSTLSSSALAERMKEYQLPFEPGMNCSFILVRMDGGFGDAVEHDDLLFEYAVHNIACEILEPDYNVWYCKDTFGYLCFLLQDNGKGGSFDTRGDNVLEKSAYELQLKVSAFLKGQVSVLISDEGIFPDELALHYRKSLNEFRKVPRSDKGIMIMSGMPRVQSRSLQSLYSPPSIQQLLEAGRWGDVRKKLSDVFEEMSSKKMDTEENMMEVTYTLMNAFLYIAHLQGKTLMEVSGLETDVSSDPRALSRADQVMEWAVGVLESMESGSIREFRDSKNQLISKIHRFIETHIAQDVSLQTIADHVTLHPVYLSSMYKQEMKENISDFIMRYRMEKAAVMLGSTDIKIYELASQMGFQNPPYFSKLFKNYYGVTPQEYRDRHITQS